MPKNQHTNHFPTKLHELLDEAEAKGHSSVISWCPDGKSFRIHDPQGMVPILTNYFRQTKYKSLLRQLQGYNFKRITSGQDKGNVSHPLFLKGERHLCTQMKRKQNSPKTQSNASKPNGSTKTNKAKRPNRAKSEGKNAVTGKRSAPVPTVTKSNGSDIQKLESNFRSSMMNSQAQPQTKHQMTTVFSAPHPISENAHGQIRPRPAGMEALRVEIGCTFSSSKKGDRKTKRMVSAPEFDSGRLSKRQRSYEVGPMNHPMIKPATFQNASFPFASMRGYGQQQEEGIVKEEKINFLKSEQEKQNQIQFKQLEKLCFSNNAQQFDHSHHFSSAMGTLDLDISLTTTTTTTHQNGSNPEVKSSTITNKFVLPSQFEPTPIISPKRGPTKSSKSISDGFTLSCDIDFSSRDFSTNIDNSNTRNTDIFLKVPSVILPQDKHISECTSMSGDVSLGRASEVSDEIDEGIAEAFGEDGIESKWADATFESDCEEDEEDWTKGITYEGKTDCVLEPEKFQIEVQSLLTGAKHEQFLQREKQLVPQRPNSLVPQSQFIIQQHQQSINQLPRRVHLGQQPTIALHQPQRQPFQNPYALLSKPMPFRQQNFPNTVQIHQIQR